MTLKQYLQHRRPYEFILLAAMFSLITVVNVTTTGIEFMRSGMGPGWREAWATELTSVFMVVLLIVPLALSLNWLDLRLANLKRRVLWLIPIFLSFSLLHVVGMVGLRKLIWALVGDEYSFSPWLLGLVYELRKDLLTFLVITTSFYAYRFIIDRLQGEAQFLGVESPEKSTNARTQFLVKMLDREYLVQVDDIDWVQSASNYVVLHCGNRSYPMRQTMKRLSEELESPRFQRVHRTAIVNLEKVEFLQDKGETSAVLYSGVNVPVSKTYLQDLRAALDASCSARSN
ncbi:MAG: LytTR family DNA-binding domain-containing protein [Gammaproteobacteria bacterium]